jgi:hypothetical protein
MWGRVGPCCRDAALSRRQPDEKAESQFPGKPPNPAQGPFLDFKAEDIEDNLNT